MTTSSLAAEWQRLKHSPPGERFEAFNERRRRTGGAVKALYLGGALVALAVGVVLVFIPGPAFVFFILAGALLAAQSRWVAQRLDRLEVKGRETVARTRAWWRRIRHKRG